MNFEELNSDDFIENLILTEEEDNVQLAITGWEKAPNKPQTEPTIIFEFEAVSGKQIGKKAKEFLPDYGKARFRIRELLIACGFYELRKKTKEDGTDYEYKAVTGITTYDDTQGCVITANLRKETYNNKTFIRLHDKREYKGEN